ncbi:hypothetical protein [Streptomyces roseochromogenus]|uniref:Uncharacterized protein n=1 Tax=Streptomyces roseochromogenus subsp. oscitans DS 12.976 TaxID=1352936 RepID=V6JX34_STRRC|nr:hypothetical protein [Streptomyces roseochromogenus]EST24387.1 hypothetical protein M878_30710 [Streptomyces roseochromogenus subsp. oscitans DS 12.976]
MPSYTYTGDEGRYYPRLGLTPEPGAAYELEKNPGDGRWTPPDPEPEPPAAEAAPPVAASPAPTKTSKRTTTTPAAPEKEGSDA